MAHVLSVSDGTTTVNLMAAPTYFVERYAPGSPEVQAATVAASLYGGEVGQPRYENVTESVDLFLKAASVAALQALVQSIEAMLQKAHRRQRLRVGERVFLQLQLDGEAQSWRSEILTGRLVVVEDGLELWPNRALTAQLIVQRRPFWEGAEVELQLSTSTLSAATGGRTIYNHDDSGSGHDNWVQIASSQVGGVLPAPVRLEMRNTAGATVYVNGVHLAVDAFGDPAFGHVVEGESRSSGGTVTADGNSSGGSYNSLSIPGAAEMVFSLAASLVQNSGGRYWRLLARLPLVSGNVYLTPILRNSAGREVWRGAEVLVTYLVTDLGIKDWGAVPLPPVDLGATAGGLQLVLSVRYTGAGTGNLQLDFVQLTPTEYVRRLRLGGTTLAANDVVVDDGIEDRCWCELSSVRQPAGAVEGAPLMVWPGRTQRLFVLFDEVNGGPVESVIGRTLSVRAYYRPRRLTV